MSEAEACRKEKPQELATKNVKALVDETSGAETETATNDFKIDYRAAPIDALDRVQQELATKETEQKAKLELENERTQEQLNAFEASVVEETKAPSSFSMKLNMVYGQTFGMVPQGSKIQSIISLDTTLSIQRGRKFGYALPMRKDYEETPNLKKHGVKDCPIHANKDLKRVKIL